MNTLPIAAREKTGVIHARRALVVCDQWLGSNGYAGMKALRRAGWSVHVMPEWEFVPVKWQAFAMRALGRVLRRAAVREYNEALVRACSEQLPDLLLVFKGTFVTGKSLRKLRSLGVRMCCFFPDNSARAHGPYLPDALPEYDQVFTTKSFGVRDLESLGVRNVELLHHAFDPDLHRPIELNTDDCERYGCDVSFIGTWSPKKESYLNALAANTEVHLRIWGAQWERAREARLRAAIGYRTLEGDEYVRAIRASRINLGLLSEQRRGASAGDQITSRTFHIPASGGFMLHERTPELLSIFEEDKNIACFGSPDELATSVPRWLDNVDGRRSIARCGSELVHAAHSWDHRIAELTSRLDIFDQS